MQVRVLFFGMLRDRFGDAELLDVADGTIVADVLNVYKMREPKFPWDSIAIAVNQEYARAERQLGAQDEVALLPPVSGGSERQGRNAG